MSENNNDNLLEPVEYEARKVNKRAQPPKRAVNGPTRKERRLKEAQARRFLCLMLSLIVIFVAIVCIFVNKNNEKYLSQQKLEEISNVLTTENTSAPSTQAAVEDTVGVVVTGTTEEKASTTEPTVSDTTTTVATTQKSEDSPSFNNPETVTDCSFDTVVVNRNYRIPSSYEADLVYVCGTSERLQTDVAKQYEAMYNAGLKDGVTLTPYSGYRSYSKQETIYQRKVEFYKGQGYSEDEAKIKAATIIMVPGSSEHNLGYAMDIVCVQESFETTPEFKWLIENAADYGFILRYPKDKTDITMVIYEPWHWRFVGVEAAKAIKASGLTMEEYYGKSAQ